MTLHQMPSVKNARRSMGDLLFRQKQETFSKELGIYSNAIGMLAKRQIFYEALLSGNETLLEKYGPRIGETSRQERIELALENSHILGKELAEHIPFLFRQIADYEAGSRSLYMEENSPCEITRVCVCEFGRKEPYIGSCMGDITTITEDPISREQRMQQGFAHLMIPHFSPLQ